MRTTRRRSVDGDAELIVVAQLQGRLVKRGYLVRRNSKTFVNIHSFPEFEYRDFPYLRLATVLETTEQPKTREIVDIIRAY